MRGKLKWWLHNLTLMFNLFTLLSMVFSLSRKRWMQQRTETKYSSRKDSTTGVVVVVYHEPLIQYASLNLPCCYIKVCVKNTFAASWGQPDQNFSSFTPILYSIGSFFKPTPNNFFFFFLKLYPLVRIDYIQELQTEKKYNLNYNKFCFREEGFNVTCGCSLTGASTRGCIIVSRGKEYIFKTH